VSGEAGGGYRYPDDEDEWCAGHGDDDPHCTWCGGEPWNEDCANPLECECGGRGGHCSACANTGLARFQTIW
jgi:hypothetical protein